MGMRAIPAGAKDFAITLQQKIIERTPAGGVRETWEDIHQVMASRRDSRGGEDYESFQKVGYGATTWRIWYRDDIDAAGWRVKDALTGKVYDIHSMVMIGRRQELELLTQHKDNEQ